MPARHIVPAALLGLAAGLAVPAPAGAAGSSGGVTTALVSLTTDGYQVSNGPVSPSITSDGRLVTWTAEGPDLNNVAYVRDNRTGITERLDTDGSGNALGAGVRGLVHLAANGSRALFVEEPVTSEQQPATTGPFLVAKDLVTGDYVTLSDHIDNIGGISDDGNIVVWDELLYNNGDFTYRLMAEDLRVGAPKSLLTTTDGKSPNGQVLVGDVSGDGSTIAFCSAATNLDVRASNPNLCQPFTVPTSGGVPHLVTTSTGTVANDTTFLYADALDYTGSKLAFSSFASNWTAGDKNANTDVFVADLSSGAVARQTLTSTGAYAYGQGVLLKSDGTTVVFRTDLALLPEDNNGVEDLYTRVIATGALSRLPIGHNSKANYNVLDLAMTPDWQRLVISSYDPVVVGDLNQNGDIFAITLPGTPAVAAVSDKTTASASSISWTNPADISSVNVRIAPTSAPTSETEGTSLYSGAGSSTSVSGLAPDTVYGVAIFTRDSEGALLSRKVTSFRTLPPPAATTFTRTSAASSTVTYGLTCTATATLKRTSGGAAVAGATGDVMTRVPGSSTWTRAAGFTTNSSGVASYAFHPPATRYVYFRFAGTDVNASSSSASQTCLVKPTISLTPSASSVTYGSKVKLSGTVKPGRSGAVVYVQRYYSGAWRNVATLKTTSTGAYVTYITPAKGTFNYRVSKPAVSDLTAATSRTVSLKAA